MLVSQLLVDGVGILVQLGVVGVEVHFRSLGSRRAWQAAVRCEPGSQVYRHGHREPKRRRHGSRLLREPFQGSRQLESECGESVSSLIRSTPTRGRSGSVEGSVKVVNQKFRSSKSIGEKSPKSSESSRTRCMDSMRSMSIGTQPIPPSDKAILIFGKRKGTRAKSQSAVVSMPLIGKSAPRTAGGESFDGTIAWEEEPTCRLMMAW